MNLLHSFSILMWLLSLLHRHPMFVLYRLKSDYWTLNEGCGRAGNQPSVIEPESSFRMIDLPTSTS